MALSPIVGIIIVALYVVSEILGSTNLSGITCGKQFDRVPKIVGGIASFQDEFPWIVSLKQEGKHFCSGSLIHSRYVLTAAQCFSFRRNVTADSVNVTTGEYFLEEPELPVNSIDYTIERVIIHPDYKEQTHENDIALIRLSKNVFVRPPTWPACLADYGKKYDGVRAVSAGWGVTMERDPSVKNSGKLAPVLNKVKLPIWKNSDCQQSLDENSFNFTLKYNHLCAGVPKGGKDTCRGDSGGPLMVKSEDGNAIDVVGVTIGGRGCGRPGLPGIYTRVSDYLGWIESNIEPKLNTFYEFLYLDGKEKARLNLTIENTL